MSSLDTTKKQHFQRQVMSQAADKRSDHLELIYRERMLPKMEFIYAGLGKLCEDMNHADNTVKADYFVEGLGHFDNLRQTDYQVSADNLIEINEIAFTYQCLSQGELNVDIEGKKTVYMFIKLLHENKLKFKTVIEKDKADFVTGAKFKILRYVPVSFTFKTDIKNSMIELRIRNYDTLGEACFQFSPESIRDDFMAKLSGYVARKSKGFFSLDLPEIERRRIRAKVLYEQQLRAAELEAADKMSAEHDMRSKGFFHRLIGR